MKTIGQKIKQIDGLRGTRDITAWQEGFIASIVARTGGGERTTMLTEKQIKTIEGIYDRHFAG